MGVLRLMTDEKVLQLREKVISARSALMKEHPFFALLLMHLKYVVVPEMEQISTNGICVFFDLWHLERYGKKELELLLCHQAMHIISGDMLRPSREAGDEFHYLCDVRVNEELKKCGFNTNSYVYVRSMPEAKKKGAFGAPRYRRMADSDEYWDKVFDFGETGTVILEAADADFWLKRPVSKATIKEAWESRGKFYAKTLDESFEKNSAGKGRSYTSLLLERKFKLKEKRVADWKRILREFVEEQTFDYSFCPPDKRFGDGEFFLPDFNEKEYVVKDVLFMVDTSGSILDEDLDDFYSELKSIAEQFGECINCSLGFFDSEIKEPQTFESVVELKKIIPYGKGGTSYSCIFEYVAKKRLQPACIIIFTDGECEYPEEKDAMGIPVLWIINNGFITPPWGKVVRIIKERVTGLDGRI